MPKILKISLIALTCILLLVGSWFVYSKLTEKPDFEGWAQSAVPPGTPREEAVEILESRAWYDELGHTDLFFYGSHRYNRALLLEVDYDQLENGEYVVARVYYVEQYLWHTTSPYTSRINRSRFK